jgi:hypothetical protein
VNEVEQRNRGQNPVNFGVCGAQGELRRAPTRPGAFGATRGEAPGLAPETNDGKNRPSEALDDVGDGELPGIHRELVSPNPAPSAEHDAVLREVEQDDSQEFAGNAFTFCELGDGKAAGARPSDAREGPDAVGRFSVEHVYYTISIDLAD